MNINKLIRQHKDDFPGYKIDSEHCGKIALPFSMLLAEAVSFKKAAQNFFRTSGASLDLFVLYALEINIPSADLADVLGVEHSHVALIISKLIQNGYLKRESSLKKESESELKKTIREFTITPKAYESLEPDISYTYSKSRRKIKVRFLFDSLTGDTYRDSYSDICRIISKISIEKKKSIDRENIFIVPPVLGFSNFYEFKRIYFSRSEDITPEELEYSIEGHAIVFEEKKYYHLAWLLTFTSVTDSDSRFQIYEFNGRRSYKHEKALATMSKYRFLN